MLPDWLGPTSEAVFNDYWLAMLISLAGAFAAWVLYIIFYRDWERGAGVHRTFLLGGPAITAMFIAIQFSLPLSLGLLGALSFVRFRTPVKDPAEIGFLLLVIASSISAATYNYALVGLVFLIAAAVLFIGRVAGDKFNLSGFLPGGRDLLLVLPADQYAEAEPRLQAFLQGALTGIHQESITQTADAASIHIRFRSSRYDDRWAEFRRELNEAVAPAEAEVHVS